MRVIRYMWANKALAALALLGVSAAVWLFKENYHIAIVSLDNWNHYQQSIATYCDSACQADIMSGLMDQAINQ